MTVALATKSVQEEINQLLEKLDEPRPDLALKFSWYVPDVMGYTNVTFDQIYTLVCQKLRELDEKISKEPQRMSADGERQVHTHYSQDQYARAVIYGLNRETGLIDIGRSTHKALSQARRMLPFMQPLADAISSFSYDLIKLVASFV